MKGLVIIKKIGIFMSLLMGFTLSLVMSLVGTLTSGHFTVGSWLISFGISFVISMIIGLIVPMPKLEAAACAKFRLKPHTFPANALSALISNTIYTPLMSVVMVLIMVGSANAGIQNGIDALTKQIGAASSELSEVQTELSQTDAAAEPQKAGELHAKIGELNGRIAEMNGQISGMEAAKPPMGMSILVSLLWCYPIGYVVILIVQPLYMKLLMKKFGPPHGALRNGPPQGTPRNGPPANV